MITPELVAYIKEEFGKGNTREAIHAELVRSGGWSESDLSEAFRTVIPMQSAIAPAATSPKVKSKLIWEFLILVVLAVALSLSWYFYRPQILSFWNGGVNKITSLTASYFGSKKSTDNLEVVSPTPVATVPTENVTIKDCGVTTAPNIKNSTTYQNNAVLNCLGDSVLSCTSAQAVLNDPLFPTIFQVARNGDSQSCNFILSYGQDSTLVDITGNRLAGQYISCPLSIVKAIDETKKTPVFNAPRTDNPSMYASQIYFYGTLGIFMENNVDQNKIQSLGCSGPYISSVVAGYNNAQGKK